MSFGDDRLDNVDLGRSASGADLCLEFENSDDGRECRPGPAHGPDTGLDDDSDSDVWRMRIPTWARTTTWGTWVGRFGRLGRSSGTGKCLEDENSDGRKIGRFERRRRF